MEDPSTPPKNGSFLQVDAPPPGRFVLTVTFRAKAQDIVIQAECDHGPSPKDFMSTVDDFQEHINDDGWWLYLNPSNHMTVGPTPGESAPNSALLDELSPRRSRGLKGIVPLKGQLSASVSYFKDDKTTKSTVLLELPFDDYFINLTIADVLTKKRKRDDAVHTLYHVDQHRSREKCAPNYSDLLVLLFSTLPSGEYSLEGIRMFLPLKLLPPEFAEAAESYIEDQRRQRSARKKIKFNAGGLEQGPHESFRAPPAFRVAHPDAEYDTTLRSEDVESLDFAQLKTELKQRGVNASGKKKDLVSKLKQVLASSAPSQNRSDSLAPPPSPASKTPKSALKVRKPSGEEVSNLEEVAPLAMKLDFSTTTATSEPKRTPMKVAPELAVETMKVAPELAVENEDVPKSPTKTPTPSQAKRQRRSSLALVGLPDRQPSWRSPRRKSIGPENEDETD